MKIPFVDLKEQYLALKDEINSAISQIFDESSFVGGHHVKEFEEAFADAYGVKHCIGVGNGTDAIFITLKMLGIGQGDEVITVGNSWISTSETITLTGAKPVFVDIEKDYYNIDTSKIEEKINTKTKAIVPVHLYGQAAQIDVIKQICNKYNLSLIEDCAQAHFAEFNAQKVGTFGIAGTFSFYPGKNFGAYGDGGCIITNNDELAVKIRMYANHGALIKHQHLMEGVNSRLDCIQCAILKIKLPHIQKWNDARLKNALLYNMLLSDLNQVHTPDIRPNCKHIFHIYNIRVENRKDLIDFLNTKNIQTSIHYPTPLPLLPAYKYLNHHIDEFPVCVGYMDKNLSLPMYPELNEEKITYIVDSIKEFYKN